MEYVFYIIGALLLLFSRKRKFCSMKNHKLIVVKKYKFGIEKCRCEKCGKEFGINHPMQAVIEWDEEMERVHKKFEIDEK